MESSTSTNYFTITQHGGNWTYGDLLLGHQRILIVGPYTVNGEMIYTVYVCYNPLNSGSRLDFSFPLYNTEDVRAQAFAFRVTENQATLSNEDGEQCITLSVNSWKDSSTMIGHGAICHFSADQLSDEVTISIK